MKTLSHILIAILLTVSTCSAEVGVSFVATDNAPDYSHVISHHAFDEESTDMTKFSGASGTVTYDTVGDAGISTTTKKVGTGSYYHSYNTVTAPVSGNISVTDGCIGIWYVSDLTSTNTGTLLYTIGNDLKIGLPSNASGSAYVSLNYRGTYQNTLIADFWATYDGWRFWWVKMDGTTATLYIDDNEILSVTGTGNFDDTVFGFCGFDAVDGHIDNFISSNDKNFDLYSIALVEDFS